MSSPEARRREPLGSPEAQTLAAYLRPITSLDEDVLEKLHSLLKITVELRKKTHFNCGRIQRGSPGAGNLGLTLGSFRGDVAKIASDLEELFTTHSDSPGIRLMKTQFSRFNQTLNSDFNDGGNEPGYSERVHLLEKLMYLTGILRGHIEMLLDHHGYWGARIAGEAPPQQVARHLDFNQESDPVDGQILSVATPQMLRLSPRARRMAGHQPSAQLDLSRLNITAGGNTSSPNSVISVKVDLSQHSQSGVANLWETKKHTDVTFVVEGTRVEAHRVILASQSEYFDCLLFGEMREAHERAEIPLQDTPVEGFRLLLKYAYTGLLEMTQTELSNVLEVVAVADRFGFTLLKMAIGAQLAKHVNKDNVFEMLVHADLCAMSELHQKCLKFCDKNAPSILESDGFLSLPENSLKSILSRDTFDVPEVSIFEALLKWKEHNSCGREEMGELLDCVRLTRITPQELFQSIEPHALFTEMQILTAIRTQTKPQLEQMKPRGRKDIGRNLFKTGESSFSNRPYVSYPAQMAGAPPSITEGIVSLGTGTTGTGNPAYGGVTFTAPAAAGLVLGRGGGIGSQFGGIQRSGYATGLQSGSNLRSSVTISFSTVFLVNQLLLEGYPNSDTAGGKWFSYKAMISLDQKQWTLLFDYSALHCYSLQRLRFPTQAAKYIQFDLTGMSDTNQGFTMKFISCSVEEDQKPFHFRDKGVIAPLAPLTPCTTPSHSVLEGGGSQSTILFHQPYSISNIKLQVAGSGWSGVTVLVGVDESSAVEVKAQQDQTAQSVFTVSFKERVVCCVVVKTANPIAAQRATQALSQSPSSAGAIVTPPRSTLPQFLSSKMHSPPALSQQSSAPVTQGQQPSAPVTQGQQPSAPLTQGQQPSAPLTQGQQPSAPLTLNQQPTSTGLSLLGQQRSAPVTQGQQPTSSGLSLLALVGQQQSAPVTQGQQPTSTGLALLGQQRSAPVTQGQQPTSSGLSFQALVGQQQSAPVAQGQQPTSTGLALLGQQRSAPVTQGQQPTSTGLALLGQQRSAPVTQGQQPTSTGLAFQAPQSSRCTSSSSSSSSQAPRGLLLGTPSTSPSPLSQPSPNVRAVVLEISNSNSSDE